MYINERGVNTLWSRIGAVFARRTEAGHALTWNSPNLGLTSVSGASLGTVNLGSGLATDAEAAHSLSLSNSSLVLKSVTGATLATVSLKDLIDDAVSGGTDGLISQDAADGRYGAKLRVSGNQLQLLSKKDAVLVTVTLP